MPAQGSLARSTPYDPATPSGLFTLALTSTSTTNLCSSSPGWHHFPSPSLLGHPLQLQTTPGPFMPLQPSRTPGVPPADACLCSPAQQIPEILLQSCLHALASHSSGVSVPTGLLPGTRQVTNDLREPSPAATAASYLLTFSSDEVSAPSSQTGSPHLGPASLPTPLLPRSSAAA